MLYNPNNFSIWMKCMITFPNFIDSNLMESIKKGPRIPPMDERKWSDEDKQKVRLHNKAMYALKLSLPNEIFGFVMKSE